MIIVGEFSSVLHENIGCWYSLESPNEYPQRMFLWSNKQNYPLIIVKYPPYLFYCTYAGGK